MWTPTHVQVTINQARSLISKGKNDTNDAYVTISLGKEKYQTTIKERSKDPQWHEECDLHIPDPTAVLQLNCYHRNLLGIDEFLGHTEIPLDQFPIYERPRNRWYVLKNKPGSKKAEKYRGEIEAKITFLVQSLSGSQAGLDKTGKVKKSASFKTIASAMGEKLNVKWPSKGSLTLNRTGSDDRRSFADSGTYQSIGCHGSPSIHRLQRREIHHSHDFLPTSYNNYDDLDGGSSNISSVDDAPLSERDAQSSAEHKPAAAPARTSSGHKKRRLNRISLLSQSSLAIPDSAHTNDASKYCRSTDSANIIPTQVSCSPDGNSARRENDPQPTITCTRLGSGEALHVNERGVDVGEEEAACTTASKAASPAIMITQPAAQRRFTSDRKLRSSYQDRCGLEVVGGASSESISQSHTHAELTDSTSTRVSATELTTTNRESVKGSTGDGKSVKGSTLDSKGIKGSTGDRKSVKGSIGDRKSVKGSTLDSKGIKGSTEDRKSVKGSTGDGESVKESTLDSKGSKGSTGDRKSVKGSTGDGECVKGSTGDREGVKSSTLDSKGIKGSTGDRKSVTGSTGVRKSINGSTGDGESVKGSTGDRKSVKGSPGNGESIKGSPGGREDVKGSTDNKESVTNSPGYRKTIKNPTGGSITGVSGIRGSVKGSTSMRGSVKAKANGSASVDQFDIEPESDKGLSTRCCQVVAEPSHSVATPTNVDDVFLENVADEKRLPQPNTRPVNGDSGEDEDLQEAVSERCRVATEGSINGSDVTCDSPKLSSPDRQITTHPSTNSTENLHNQLGRSQSLKSPAQKVPPPDSTDQSVSPQESPGDCPTEEEEEKFIASKLRKMKDQSGRHTLQYGSSAPRRSAHELYEGIYEYKKAQDEKAQLNRENSIPEDILASFENHSRQDLIKLTMEQQLQLHQKELYIKDLENYIDNLLVRVIEATPGVLQNPQSPVKPRRGGGTFMAPPLRNNSPTTTMPASQAAGPLATSPSRSPSGGKGCDGVTVGFSPTNPNVRFINSNNSNNSSGNSTKPGFQKPQLSNPFKKLQAALK